MGTRKVKVQVRLEEDIVKKIDEVVKKAKIGNRSIFIRMAILAALKPYLTPEEKKAFETLFGGEKTE